MSMRLKAVYFLGKSATGLPYKKAMVYIQDVPYFEKMGAVLVQPEIVSENDPKGQKQLEIKLTYDSKKSEDEQPADEIIDPDKGYGEPGSLRWHVLQINEISEKQNIIDYVSLVIKKDAESLFDRRLSLANIKREAKRIIKEHLESGNQNE